MGLLHATSLTDGVPSHRSSLQPLRDCARHPRLPIVSCCGDGAVVESWDLRDQTSPLQTLKAPCAFLCCDIATPEPVLGW